MFNARKRTYPGKILSIRKANTIGEVQQVLIQEEWTTNIHTYQAYDVLFFTTHDKLTERICMITENTKKELLKISLDDSNDNITTESKIVYRFDNDLLQTYLRTSLYSIKNRLRQQHIALLNTVENKEYFIKMLDSVPYFVLDQWHFHEWKKSLVEHPEYTITPEESEKIHFFYYAYEAADKIYKLKHNKKIFLDNINNAPIVIRVQWQDIAKYLQQHEIELIVEIFEKHIVWALFDAYEEYQKKAVNHDNLISEHIMEQYIEVFLEEIRNTKEWHQTSIKVQRAQHMYNNLDPLYKYHLFEESIKLPLTQLDYSYLHTIYVAQNLYKSFSANEYFQDMLTLLIQVAKKVYPYWVENMEVGDNNILYNKDDLFEYDVFGPEWQVEISLYEAFDYLIAEAYYEFEEKKPKPSFSLIDRIHEKLMLGMWWWVVNERWLYYTVFMIQRIHELTLDNKNENTIQKT